MKFKQLCIAIWLAGYFNNKPPKDGIVGMKEWFAYNAAFTLPNSVEW